jgi:hypothetical protein
MIYYSFGVKLQLKSIFINSMRNRGSRISRASSKDKSNLFGRKVVVNIASQIADRRAAKVSERLSARALYRSLFSGYTGDLKTISIG